LQEKKGKLGAKRRGGKKKKQNLRFALAEGPVHHIEILFASPHSYHLSLFCQERCKYSDRKAPQRKARKARSPALSVQQCDRPLASVARLNASRQTGNIRAAQKISFQSLHFKYYKKKNTNSIHFKLQQFILLFIYTNYD
jgi:hypothetical protein